MFQITDGNIQPGQYQIPFQFLSNENWPASFEYKRSDKKGRIKYELKASVVSKKVKLHHKT